MEGITKRFGNLVGGLKNTWNNITGGVNAVRNFVQAEPQQINPVVQTPVTPQAPVVSPIQPKPLYVNGITSDPTEMAKNRADLATSIANLSPQPITNFNLANNDNTYDSSSINTGVTRQDVINKVNTMQSDFANGNIPDAKPTSGYQKFITDYSNAVQYSPEQQAAYKGQQQTASAIADIQRNLQNRQAELTQNGALSPAQVAADMKQYTTEANSRIADLQASNRDYTLTFNALENARQNTLQAYGVQAPFYKPTEISPGSQIIDPSTGQIINQGTGVSPSTAISYASQIYQNDLTSGQPKLTPDGQVDSAYYYQQATQQLSGRNGFQVPSTSMGIGTQQTQMPVPPSIQSSLSYINNKPYIDMGNLNANQLPIAQQYSANQAKLGISIPILNEKDATALKDANKTFNAADTLMSTIHNLSSKLITATDASGIPLQYAKITINSILRDPDARAFTTSIDAFSSLLTRAAGEKGTLTDQDVTRIINALPTKTDTIASAAKKAETLSNIYESIKQGAISTYLDSKQPQVQNSSQFIGNAWK